MQHGDNELVLRILELGVPADAMDHCGITPLHEAAKALQVDTVRILLAAGAAPNNRDFDGRTPLDRVAQGHHPGLGDDAAQRARAVEVLRQATHGAPPPPAVRGVKREGEGEGGGRREKCSFHPAAWFEWGAGDEGLEPGC